MKTNILIAFLALFSLAANSQPAPNFIVTDSDGVIHNLYEDHLDQGQTVVLKLFFINCPPCNTYAPHVQTLYEEWGEGQYDVEFFELSIFNTDSNAEVADYQAGHGLTFPGVGGDGGSVPATTPYRDGTYGPYYGTPTFVVIAPDGTVTYDPTGPGVQGTIDAIDAAIAATGATGSEEDTGPDPFTVDIDITNQFNQPVPGIQVIVKSDGTDDPVYDMGVTDNNGGITFLYPNNDLPEIENPVVYFQFDGGDPDHGLSTLDLVLSQRHALGINPIEDPFLVVASDVNSSGSLSAADLIDFRRMILGLIVQWPNSPTYKFVNEDCDFDNDPFAYNCQSVPLAEEANGLQTIDIKRVKMGDVNLSGN